MEEEIIQFIGVKDLEPMEQEEVQRLTTESYPKIKRALKNITSLKVHVKTYKKGRAKEILTPCAGNIPWRNSREQQGA